MDIPTENTFKILEERKKFLLNKNKSNDYIKAEISALDRVLNFSKYIINNFPDDMIKDMAGKNENAEKNIEKESLEEYETLYSYEKKITENKTLEISYIKNTYGKYIILKLNKFSRAQYKWFSQGNIQLNQKTLEEILNNYTKIKDI